MLLIAGFIACKKEGSDLAIVGKWELRHESGGWGVDRSHAPGNGNIYEFKASQFTKTTPNDTTITGRYSINLDRNENNYKTGTIIFNNSENAEPIRFNTDTLFIGTSVADGIVWEYVKIK